MLQINIDKKISHLSIRELVYMCVWKNSIRATEQNL